MQQFWSLEAQGASAGSSTSPATPGGVGVDQRHVNPTPWVLSFDGFYPDGRPVHHGAEPVPIAVTAVWTASWSGGDGESGTLPALRPRGSLPDFEAYRVQAVRER